MHLHINLLISQQYFTEKVNILYKNKLGKLKDLATLIGFLCQNNRAYTVLILNLYCSYTELILI